MASESWLGLTDYASKHRISVSTLRRRIKNHQIAFRLQDGKYFVLDAAGAQNEAMRSYSSDQESHSSEIPPAGASAHARPAHASDLTGEAHNSMEAPILSTAAHLLNELKRAYSNILQEKEEQLIQLKAEVADLKTLVRVLEDDNERLRAMTK